MLIGLIKKLIQDYTKVTPANTKPEETIDIRLLRAGKLLSSGQRKQAIELFRAILKEDPDNVHAMNDLACALGDIGNVTEAAKLFVDAYTIDERFLPAIINHAALLMENRDNTEALDIIKIAKIAEPDFTGINSAYATYLFSEGRTVEARPYKLKEWLANFDSLRAANAYLFYCTYDHSLSEDQLTAEHIFWAKTQTNVQKTGPEKETSTPQQSKTTNQIKIGYISPDIKDHSVKYFFRPLLRAHDVTNFSIVLFDDTLVKDEDTKKIRSDNVLDYHDVSNLTDAALLELINDQQLDVLVELAGHTSHNRISLFSRRLASLQISALGYPPTTGLAGMDFKLMDPWILHPSAELYYSETPLILPQSFWCFDPVEKIDDPGPAPQLANGYVTFGCQGNIAKISDKMLETWATIMTRCPNSRLLIRAINFKDSGVLSRFKDKLTEFNIPEEKLILYGPATTSDFFKSYDQIDIMLDTFPFNGGTTTAFGLYMGVPMVSRYGLALPSRMGRSMLSNLGMDDLAVDSMPEYIEAAVSLANDIKRRIQFRLKARELFASSALGNGTVFARHFEHAIVTALNSAVQNTNRAESPSLTCEEMVRRAYTALSFRQPEASERIAALCLEKFPTSGLAHVLASNMLSRKGDLTAALEYLNGILPLVEYSDRVTVVINMMKLALMTTDSELSSSIFNTSVSTNDEIEKLQIRLLQIAYKWANSENSHLTEIIQHPTQTGLIFLIAISTDDPSYFERTKYKLHSTWILSPSSKVEFVQIRRTDRVKYLNIILEKNSNPLTFVVLIQSDALPVHPHFLAYAVKGMMVCDVLSYAGSEDFHRIDWLHAPFHKRHGVVLSHSDEHPDFTDVQLFGSAHNSVETGLSVLSGKLLIFKPHTWLEFNPNEDLLHAGCLMEEAWTHVLAIKGKILAVSHRLGVSILGEPNPQVDHLTSGRQAVVEEFGLQVFSDADTDRLLLTAPCPSIQAGMLLIDYLFENAQ